MAISASDVKQLREETGAPMMECKKALEEAGGDKAKAKEILRESGQAAAAKRAGRSTAEGLAVVAVSDDKQKAAGIVVECETDFVAKNESFKDLVNKLLQGVLAAANPGAGEVQEITPDFQVDGKPISQHLEEAVAVIRENIRLGQGAAMGAASGAVLVGYNHSNTGKAATLVEVTGSGEKAEQAAFQTAVQAVAFPPDFLKREDVPQDVIENEIRIETNRAVSEGKPEDVANKIAQGRVNKEYYQSKVLLEQPFYMDAKKKTGDFVKEETGGSATITNFRYFSVGGNSQDEE